MSWVGLDADGAERKQDVVPLACEISHVLLMAVGGFAAAADALRYLPRLDRDSRGSLWPLGL